jgi:hypothetical protein
MMADNMLSINAEAREILEENINFVDKMLDGKAIFGDQKFLLDARDIWNIKRRIQKRDGGLDLRRSPDMNLHLMVENDADIKDACAHYKPRTDKTDRFEIVLITSKQKELAWQHGHRKMILLDGTFGVCDRKVLLIIIMVLNEHFHGIPVGWLLFSAPGGNRNTCAGYNADILRCLLGKWRDALGYRNGEPFKVVTPMIDTDHKERAALNAVWPGNSFICIAKSTINKIERGKIY